MILGRSDRPHSLTEQTDRDSELPDWNVDLDAPVLLPEADEDEASLVSDGALPRISIMQPSLRPGEEEIQVCQAPGQGDTSTSWIVKPLVQALGGARPPEMTAAKRAYDDGYRSTPFTYLPSNKIEVNGNVLSGPPIAGTYDIMTYQRGSGIFHIVAVPTKGDGPIYVAGRNLFGYQTWNKYTPSSKK